MSLVLCAGRGKPSQSYYQRGLERGLAPGTSDPARRFEAVHDGRSDVHIKTHWQGLLQ